MEKNENMRCPDCGAVVDGSGPDRAEYRCECGAVLISAQQEQAEQVQAEEISRKWYYSRDKRRYGPVPWKRIVKLVTGRQLGPDDLLWSRGMQRWEKVRSFEELRRCFPEDERPEPPEDDTNAPGSQRSACAEGPALPEPKTFMIQVSAGLLFASGLFLAIGVLVAVYSLYTSRISMELTTWIIALFVPGAVFCIGLSQLFRLLCAVAQNIRGIKRELAELRGSWSIHEYWTH